MFWIIANQIRSLIPQADISASDGRGEELLDESIDTRGYVIDGVQDKGDDGYDAGRVIDLSNIDFDALRATFQNGHKHVEAEKLKGQLGAKLNKMVELNKQRIDYVEKFQALIDEYNSGSANIEQFFKQLMELAQQLSEEEKRHIAEQLTEEELAIFDLLTKPDPTLTKKEEQEVKKVAQDLLSTLKREKLVLGWRKRQQSSAAVWVAIQDQLDRLPQTYTPDLYAKKCNVVYQHVYDSHCGAGGSVYGVMDA